MNSKYILASIAFAALALSGCQHDLEHNMVPDKLGFSYSSNLQQPSVFKNSMDIAIIKSGKGKSSATVRIESITQEELDAWCNNDENKDAGYSFTLAPSSRYEVSANEFSFAASDTRKTFNVSWNATYFANTAANHNDNVIGFKLVDPSIDTDENRSIIIVRPQLSRVSFKSKDIKSVFPTLKDTETVNEYEGEVTLDYAIPTQDASVELVIDNSLIAGEAELREKDYEPAPEGLFTLTKSTVSFKSGETVAYFSYKIDMSVLFDEDGSFLKTNVNYMVPVKFASKNPDLMGEGDAPVGFITVTISDEIVRPSEPKTLIHGPWEILEGEDLHIGKDPECTSPGWYGNYNTSKLVDWGFGFGNNSDASKNGYWGSYFWTPIEFPIVFVFDTGATYTFEYFYKVDADTFQGQFRDFEVYVAKEYIGEGTDWKLACKGKTGDKGWQNYKDTMIDGVQSVDKVLEMFSYRIPEDLEAEGSEFNLTRGRYIKLCITGSSKVSQKDCGYIMEFYADGWEN